MCRSLRVLGAVLPGRSGWLPRRDQVAHGGADPAGCCHVRSLACGCGCGWGWKSSRGYVAYVVGSCRCSCSRGRAQGVQPDGSSCDSGGDSRVRGFTLWGSTTRPAGPLGNSSPYSISRATLTLSTAPSSPASPGTATHHTKQNCCITKK